MIYISDVNIYFDRGGKGREGGKTRRRTTDDGRESASRCTGAFQSVGKKTPVRPYIARTHTSSDDHVDPAHSLGGQKKRGLEGMTLAIWAIRALCGRIARMPRMQALLTTIVLASLLACIVLYLVSALRNIRSYLASRKAPVPPADAPSASSAPENNNKKQQEEAAIDRSQEGRQDDTGRGRGDSDRAVDSAEPLERAQTEEGQHEGEEEEEEEEEEKACEADAEAEGAEGHSRGGGEEDGEGDGGQVTGDEPNLSSSREQEQEQE